MDLPRFILLKSIRNNKYLRYRKEQDSNHALLQFSQDEQEENAEIQYGKFEVQKSEIAQGFFHIRSCYNNKYWVRKSAESKWIAAEANEAEEDSSKWSCTLFKAILLDSDEEADVDVDADAHRCHTTEPQKIRLVHIDHLGQQSCTLSDTDLVMGNAVDDDDEDGVFLAYNATSNFVLPDRVAFVGHTDQYGAVTTVSGVRYLEFKTSDIGHSGVAHALTQFLFVRPQQVTVQNTSFGWWTLNAPFIVMQASSTSRAVFTPVRLGGNLIALQSRASVSPMFANCGAGRGMQHVLGVSATSINQFAIFGVEEPVRFREVSNVNFNIQDSRIYNVHSVEKFRDERRNSTSVEQTGFINIQYEVEETENWSDSVSVTRSISAEWSSSVPFVGDFGVQLSEERNQTVVWGREKKNKRTVSFQQDVTMPPGKRIILLVVATRAQCDVPFTCRVVDTLTDGTMRSYFKSDGLFTGANEYNFLTDIIEENL